MAATTETYVPRLKQRYEDEIRPPSRTSSSSTRSCASRR